MGIYTNQPRKSPSPSTSPLAVVPCKTPCRSRETAPYNYFTRPHIALPKMWKPFCNRHKINNIVQYFIINARARWLSCTFEAALQNPSPLLLSLTPMLTSPSRQGTHLRPKQMPGKFTNPYASRGSRILRQGGGGGGGGQKLCNKQRCGVLFLAKTFHYKPKIKGLQ